MIKNTAMKSAIFTNESRNFVFYITNDCVYINPKRVKTNNKH